MFSTGYMFCCFVVIPVTRRERLILNVGAELQRAKSHTSDSPVYRALPNLASQSRAEALTSCPLCQVQRNHLASPRSAKNKLLVCETLG